MASTSDLIEVEKLMDFANSIIFPAIDKILPASSTGKLVKKNSSMLVSKDKMILHNKFR